MKLKDQIKYLNSPDGPNISLRTLAVYCGVSHTTLSRWVNGTSGISNDLRAQIQKGIKELVAEINEVLEE